MSAGHGESNSEWEIGSHDFLVLFWEAEQQQGRLRLENANRGEARAIGSRRAIGSEKALALVGPSASSGVGGTRRLVGALRVRGEHVYAKRGDLTTGCRDQKACIIFKYYSNITKTGMLVD